MRVLLFQVLLSICFSAPIFAQQLPIYKNPRYTTEERVSDLIKRMTPVEKFWQLFMIPGDLGKDPNQYKHGIFGFQVSAASMQAGVGQQLLQYNTKEPNNISHEKIPAL